MKKYLYQIVMFTVLYGGFIALGINASIQWRDDVRNPANQPYVLEVAFNLGICECQVTQEQFNARYLDES